MEDRFDFAARAQQIASELMVHRATGDVESQARALLKLANLAMNQADFAAALDYVHEADDLARALDIPELDRQVVGELTNVLLEMGDCTTALPHAERAAAEAVGIEDRMLALNTLGCALAQAGRPAQALEQLELAHALIPRIDTATDVRRRHYEAQSLADLSAALFDAGRPAEALERADAGLRVALAEGNDPLIMLNSRYAGRALLALARPQEALDALERAHAMAQRMGLDSQRARIQLDRAEALAALGRWQDAYRGQREAYELEQGFSRDSATRRLEFRKSRDAIERARREMEAAHRTLRAVLPEPIARRIQAGEAHIAEEVGCVSVLFADMVGFTAMSRTASPRAVLERLDAVFSLFDRLTAEAGLDKIKTIGDAYMAVGGALDDRTDHPERCLRLALRMQEGLRQLDEAAGSVTRVRIGMHIGPAIAGVIGRERLSFDLWGDTVNLASRLESSGMPGRVHVSAAVAKALAGRFRFSPRGAQDLKGIGEVETFFVDADEPGS